MRSNNYRIFEGVEYISTLETKHRKINDKLKVLYVCQDNVGFEINDKQFSETTRQKFSKSTKQLL